MKSNYSMQISEKTKNIPEALSIYVNQLVYSYKRRGFDITTLSLGEAFFDIPLFDFSQLDINKIYHYSESRGLPELRVQIANYYNEHYGALVDSEEEVLISTGSKPLIYMSLQTILNDGDEVLIPEPAWLSYPEQIKLSGGIPKFIPYNCKMRDFIKYFTDKTRVLIVNNPNNPAGWVYSKEDLEFLCNECKKRKIYLLVDEAYSDFILEEEFYSVANLIKEYEGVIVINSLSKNMGISGWRIGYILANKNFISHILKLNQHLITCAPTILLHYVSKYFKEILSYTLPQTKEVVRKRKRISEYMKSKGIQCLDGASTFYFFIDISKYKYTSLQFTLYLLLKYNIAVVPGSAYGKSTANFIRVSIGSESEERIIQAIDIISDVLHFQLYDEKMIEEKFLEYNWKHFEV